EHDVLFRVLRPVLVPVGGGRDRAVGEDLGADADRLYERGVAFDDPEVLAAIVLNIGQRAEHGSRVEVSKRLSGGVGERASYVVELFAAEAYALQVVAERLEPSSSYVGQFPTASEVESGAGCACFLHQQAPAIGKPYP